MCDITDQRTQLLCDLKENVSTSLSSSFSIYNALRLKHSTSQKFCIGSLICKFMPTGGIIVCSVAVHFVLRCASCRYQSSLGNKRIELFDTGNDQVAEGTPVQMASGGHQ